MLIMSTGTQKEKRILEAETLPMPLITLIMALQMKTKTPELQTDILALQTSHLQALISSHMLTGTHLTP